jgi:hypothetical protein
VRHAAPARRGILAGARRIPADRGDPRDLLHLDLSREPGDEQLDGRAGELGELRTQWEHAHATNAVFTFIALCCVAVSNLLTRD